MKILVHAKLFWQDKTFWLVGTTPITPEMRLHHDRYDVVPWQEYVSKKHSYVRFIDVPKNGYAVMETKPVEIEVDDD